MHTAREHNDTKQTQFLDVKEVARLLRLKPRTVYDMVSQRRIPYRKAGDRTIFLWQAEQAEVKLRQKIFEGKFGGLENAPRLKESIKTTYLPWAKTNKRSARDDVWRAEVLIRHFGKQRMDEIAPFQIERSKHARREGKTFRGEQRKPATVNRELELLSRIFTLAMDNGIDVQNPCRKVKHLRTDNQRNRYLSEDGEARLVTLLVGRRAHLRPIVLLALHTGMRRGEIMSLRWNQVDFSRGLILVKGTKTGHNRMVPMNAVVRETLAVLPRSNDGDPIFDINDVKRSFTYACQKAGILDFRFHDLRHTAATRLADRGADAFQISAILGHSTIQMSARYTHATSAGLRRAVESLATKQEELREKLPTISPQFGLREQSGNLEMQETKRLAG